MADDLTSCPPDGPLRFSGRHRIQSLIDIEDQGGRIVVGARPGLPFARVAKAEGCVIAALLLVWAIFPGLLPPSQAFLVATMAMLSTSGFLLIIFAFTHQEYSKGPVLELDELSRTVALPREHRRVPFEAVEGVGLLVGKSRLWGGETETLGELSLLLADAGTEPRWVPMFMTRGEILKLRAVAGRLVESLDLPPVGAMRSEGKPHEEVIWSRSLGLDAQTGYPGVKVNGREYRDDPLPGPR